MTVDLATEVKELQTRVAVLETEIANLRGRSTTPLATPEELEIVAATAQEVFSSEVSLQEMSDPEEPEWPWIVVCVKAGDLSGKELIQRRLNWHERIEKLLPGKFGRFRLSLDRD